MEDILERSFLGLTIMKISKELLSQVLSLENLLSFDIFPNTSGSCFRIKWFNNDKPLYREGTLISITCKEQCYAINLFEFMSLLKQWVYNKGITVNIRYSILNSNIEVTLPAYGNKLFTGKDELTTIVEMSEWVLEQERIKYIKNRLKEKKKDLEEYVVCKAGLASEYTEEEALLEELKDIIDNIDCFGKYKKNKVAILDVLEELKNQLKKTN